MKENVHRLEAEPGREIPPVGAKPGLGFSMQVDLGAGRVCTLQTFLPNDCSVEELNAMLDKMTKAGDRQRAHYQIEGLERDLKQYEKEQEQGQDDFAKLERDYAESQERRTKELDRATASLSGFDDAVAAANEARGVRDAKRLTSQQQANKNRVQNGIAELKEQIKIAEAEHQKALAESRKVLDRRTALIDKTKAEIDRNRKIVADGLVKKE